MEYKTRLSLKLAVAMISFASTVALSSVNAGANDGESEPHFGTSDVVSSRIWRGNAFAANKVVPWANGIAVTDADIQRPSVALDASRERLLDQEHQFWSKCVLGKHLRWLDNDASALFECVEILGQPPSASISVESIYPLFEGRDSRYGDRWEVRDVAELDVGPPVQLTTDNVSFDANGLNDNVRSIASVESLSADGVRFSSLVDGVPVDQKGVIDQSNGPNTNSSRYGGEYRHYPLRIAVAKFPAGPIEGYIAVGILACVFASSWAFTGWVGGFFKKGNRDNQRD